jgi:hypothetical protein
MGKYSLSKINYDKTIRVLEPFDGWVHHGYDNLDEATDTGLCNRLMYWQSIYNINKKYGFPYTICVEKIWWPELDIIELPNTVAIDYPEYDFQDYKQKLKKDFISKNGVYTNEDNIISKLDDINSDIDLNINHYYTSYDYEQIKEFTPFPKFKFKYEFIENIIKKYISIHTTGVHIRRGNGMSVPEIGNLYTDQFGITGRVDVEDLYSISNLEITQFNLPGEEEYIPNEYYKKVFKKLLQDNPNKNIYISADIPIEKLNPIIKMFPDKIITYDFMIDEINKNLEKNNIFFKNIQYRYVIKNIIDLFSLTYCGDFIPYPNSSWSRFVLLYSRLKQITGTKDYINEKYKSDINFINLNLI